MFSAVSECTLSAALVMRTSSLLILGSMFPTTAENLGVGLQVKHVRKLSVILDKKVVFSGISISSTVVQPVTVKPYYMAYQVIPYLKGQ